MNADDKSKLKAYEELIGSVLADLEMIRTQGAEAAYKSCL